MAGLAGMRDGVKHPAQLACAHIKGANIARRGGRALGGAKAHDDHVAPDGARRGQRHTDLVGIAAQPGAKIDAAVLAETGYRLSRCRVQGIEITAGIGEQPPFLAVAPIGQAALWPARLYAGMKPPFEFSAGAVQCDCVQDGVYA